jgi:hypothetical protein
VTTFIASLETEVPVSRSINHIRELVERFGAREFSTHYDAATRPIGIGFTVRDPRVTGDEPVYLPVQLRAPTETIYKALLASKRRSYFIATQERCRAQAERVAWRNLHDFVRASLIGVQTGIMSLGEAFMASLVVTTPAGPERLGEIVARGSLLQPVRGQLRLLAPGMREGPTP